MKFFESIGEAIGTRERFLMFSSFVFLVFILILGVMVSNYLWHDIGCMQDGGVMSSKYGCVFPVDWDDPKTETQCSIAKLKCNRNNFEFVPLEYGGEDLMLG